MTDATLVRKSLSQILTFWRSGSHEWTWAEEYADLIDARTTTAVRARVEAEGIGFNDHLAPVLLGSDGRVWDGHHRIVIAIERCIPYLNVEITTDETEEARATAVERERDEARTEAESESATRVNLANRVTALENELRKALAEVARLTAKLDMPCGSCHPCNNWANQTWVNAGERLPHVYEWRAMKARATTAEAVVASVTALVEKWEQYVAGSRGVPVPERGFAAELRAALTPTTTDETAPPLPEGFDPFTGGLPTDETEESQ